MIEKIISLVLLVAIIVFSCSGCSLYNYYQQTQDLKKLPQVERDESGNLILNGNSYIAPNGRDSIFDVIPEKRQTIAHIQTEFSANAVYGYGIEDFNEYICLEMYSALPNSRNVFWKSDFEFPNYMTSICSKIYLGSYYEHSNSDIEVMSYEEGNNLSLEDIMTEVYELDPFLEVKGYIHIFFIDYQTIYLRGATLYQCNNELYVCFDLTVNGKMYKVNDEYQEVFKNAIAERLE